MKITKRGYVVLYSTVFLVALVVGMYDPLWAAMPWNR